MHVHIDDGEPNVAAVLVADCLGGDVGSRQGEDSALMPRLLKITDLFVLIQRGWAWFGSMKGDGQSGCSPSG